MPQALAAASKSQIGVLNGQYKSLGGYANSAGTVAAKDLYGAGVSAAQGLVNGLLSQEAAITKAMKRIDSSLVKQVRKDPKIHSPSRVMFDHFANVGEGAALGIESKLARINQAGSAMGRTVGPNDRAPQDVEPLDSERLPPAHCHHLDRPAAVRRRHRRVTRHVDDITRAATPRSVWR